jgi:hypothetical protein
MLQRVSRTKQNRKWNFDSDLEEFGRLATRVSIRVCSTCRARVSKLKVLNLQTKAGDCFIGRPKIFLGFYEMPLLCARNAAGAGLFWRRDCVSANGISGLKTLPGRRLGLKASISPHELNRRLVSRRAESAQSKRGTEKRVCQIPMTNECPLSAYTKRTGYSLEHDIVGRLFCLPFC